MYKNKFFNLKRSKFSQTAGDQSTPAVAPVSQQPVAQTPAPTDTDKVIDLNSGEPGQFVIPLLKDPQSGKSLRNLLTMAISPEALFNEINISLKRQGFDPAQAEMYSPEQLEKFVNQVGLDLKKTFRSLDNYASKEFLDYVNKLK